ncbi:MAG: hypothetical protein IKA35_04130, partial [Bacteroidaceae bacterium]|nr:hypothetical protein [Bacteroidaceae bacterium]
MKGECRKKEVHLFFYAEPNPIFVANIGNNFRIIPVRDYFLLNIVACCRHNASLLAVDNLSCY